MPYLTFKTTQLRFHGLMRITSWRITYYRFWAKPFLQSPPITHFYRQFLLTQVSNPPVLISAYTIDIEVIYLPLCSFQQLALRRRTWSWEMTNRFLLCRQWRHWLLINTYTNDVNDFTLWCHQIYLTNF